MAKRKNFFIFIPVMAGLLSIVIAPYAHAQSVGVTLPSIPSGLSATASLPTQVSVSWSASAESSGTIEGYYVYRNGSQIVNTAGTAFVDSGLLPGLYSYTVAAYDANGTVSPQSSSVTVTLTADTTPPTTPTGVTITGATSTNSFYAPTTLTVSWNPSTDSIGVTGYQVFRNGLQIGSSTTPLTGTSITDTVTPGMYKYTVVAYDAAQNFSSPSTPVTVTVGIDSIPPSIPTNVSVQQVSAGGVNVSWANSTDNVSVAGYQIFRDGIQIASAGGSPYSDSGLSAGDKYQYTVAAYDEAGNVSSPSAPVQIVVQQANGIGTPYQLSVALISTSTINFSWAPVIDGLALTGYQIYRNGTQIATATSTDYLDMGLASGTYYYGVTATDVSGAVSSMTTSTNVIVPVYVPPATPTPVITPTSTTAPTPVITPVFIPSAGGAAFTQYLYFGLRSAQVKEMQSVFVANGYLSPIDATGYFGSLTLAALKKFQCDQNIVCTGGAGWGGVGPKTRTALNGIESGATPSASSEVISTSSAALAAEVQALEAELANLERQLPQ